MGITKYHCSTYFNLNRCTRFPHIYLLIATVPEISLDVTKASPFWWLLFGSSSSGSTLGLPLLLYWLTSYLLTTKAVVAWLTHVVNSNWVLLLGEDIKFVTHFGKMYLKSLKQLVRYSKKSAKIQIFLTCYLSFTFLWSLKVFCFSEVRSLT